MEDNKCSFEGCDLEKYEGHDKCILHCDKTNSSEKSQYFDTLFDFALNNYVKINKRGTTIVFKGIVFLANEFEYSFEKIEWSNVEFDDCDLIYSYEFSNIKSIFYHCCRFYCACWIESRKGAIYTFYNCVFDKEVHYGSVFDERVKHVPIFSNRCQFKNSLVISNQLFEKAEFSAYESFSSRCKRLEIFDCYFECDLIVDFENILEINRSRFSKGCKVIISNKSEQSLFVFDSIFDCDFKITQECESTDFSLVVDKSEFNGVADFSKLTIKSEPVFKLVKFNSLASFIDSKFNRIQLDSCFFNCNANFLNIHIEEPTTRETYRIIKHSFDSIGNTIEANKYFALEMKKYEEEIKKTGTKSEKFLLWVNRVTSDYGQSYTRPLFIMFIFNAILTFLYFLGANAEPGIFHFGFIDNFMSILNRFAHFILPSSIFLVEAGGKQPFITLFAGVINGILIYQLIIALKRKTRR